MTKWVVQQRQARKLSDMQPFELAPNSSLRRLPRDLDARLRVRLDGIRYAIEICLLSSRRLLSALQFASGQDPQQRTLTNDLFTSAFTDAWSIVDSGLAFLLHRLILNADPVPRDVRAWAQAQWERPTVRAFREITRPQLDA